MSFSAGCMVVKLDDPRASTVAPANMVKRASRESSL
jgi:hypothetical protein